MCVIVIGKIGNKLEKNRDRLVAMGNKTKKCIE